MNGQFTDNKQAVLYSSIHDCIFIVLLIIRYLELAIARGLEFWHLEYPRRPAVALRGRNEVSIRDLHLTMHHDSEVSLRYILSLLLTQSLSVAMSYVIYTTQYYNM